MHGSDTPGQLTRKVLLLVATTLFTFLHESGHALAAILSGGRVTAFSVNFWQLSAHVRMSTSLAARARVGFIRLG